MNKKNQAINHFLVDVFNEILKTEEALIIKQFHNLSVKEMHVIEAVCLAEKSEDGDTRSTTISSNLRITAGSLTTSVSLLEKKGYLIRKRSEKDRRVVFIHATDAGRNAYKYHEQFHASMVSDVLEPLSEEETTILIRALTNISNFFKMKYNKSRTQ